ncbi:MAG: DUF262 domain-containing protein [Candidatus Kapabacteria bacterium]|nr:DUF262 domain-containing protein [Candidatus Kapabacteria bacterium]
MISSNQSTQEMFEKVFKEHLKVETYSKSIDSLFSPRSKSRIDYKPYYQRNYVWDYSKATYFIESILLGTEIPPLIFFDNNSGVEIIDGRQRFETIKRFMENEFQLKQKGLQVLRLLKNLSYEDLNKKDNEIITKFLEAKLRIIEFKLVNQPPLDRNLEDRIKKEIFSRYNSGITPLKNVEIENAIYDKDNLTSAFKDYFQKNNEKLDRLYQTFFIYKATLSNDKPIDKVMNFVRKSLVLPMTPISYYASGASRTDIITKLYEKISNENENTTQSVIENFYRKVDFLYLVKQDAERTGLSCNRLALECFLWGFGLLELEEIPYTFDEDLRFNITHFIDKNIEYYSEVDYSFNKIVKTRFLKTAEFFQQKYQTDFSLYISPDDDKKSEIKEITKPQDTSTKLGELESLRLNKPEPSRISIDDVVRSMNRRKFLVRPSYQRKEVINPTKASLIIESILLGITLPAIFVFKRKDGVFEVIDGQQRLLTILGFIGESYVDERGTLRTSNNHIFKLKRMKILKELEGKSFKQLENEQQDKIFDFQLYLVEIDELSNEKFNPIDLFIRLNDKPFPIRENTFEMWNSWVDVDIINQIRKIKSNYESWFFVKRISSKHDIDRMENEELVTSLIFLEYNALSKNDRKIFDIHQKSDRLNSRISDKVNITNLLNNLTEKQNEVFDNYETAVKNIKAFIGKLKLILLDCDKEENELKEYLKSELDSVFSGGKEVKYVRRTMQDFYFLWHLITKLNLEMVRYHRLEIKQDVKSIFKYLKNIPLDDQSNNLGLEKYNLLRDEFLLKYKLTQRQTTLTDQQKFELLKSQNSLSPMTGSTIFKGDEIEVDHIIPISIGGKDDISNMQILHKSENREKGSSY